MDSVLRCGLCNKPFDKEASLKRHGYYCRSRKSAPASRSRSCVLCVKRKARCDSKRPNCSRCIAKGLNCHYPAHASTTGTKSKTSSLATDQDTRLDLINSIPTDALDCQDDSIILDASLENATAIPSLDDLQWPFMDWDDPNMNLTDILNAETEKSTSATLVNSSDSSPDQEPTNSPDRSIQRPYRPNNAPSIRSVPIRNIRSLVKRPRTKPGAQRTANLIIHTLRAYPRMMLRSTSLPPFIHPKLLSMQSEEIRLEPLANCMSLMHVIKGGPEGSRKLFWKNVQLECERWFDEAMNLSRWELLAAMQALSIYLLVRLDEGETDYNNIDSLLIATVIVISKQLACVDELTKIESPLYSPSDVTTGWKHWIFAESNRRLCIVYQVVNMLVHFEPAAMCDIHTTDLILAPLPAKKQLWEAPDEFAWQAEIDSGPNNQTPFGLATNGDLVKVEQLFPGSKLLAPELSEVGTESKSGENWEEWCSGMDAFGGLIMLAASFTA